MTTRPCLVRRGANYTVVRGVNCRRHNGNELPCGKLCDVLVNSSAPACVPCISWRCHPMNNNTPEEQLVSYIFVRDFRQGRTRFLIVGADKTGVIIGSAERIRSSVALEKLSERVDLAPIWPVSRNRVRNLTSQINAQELLEYNQRNLIYRLGNSSPKPLRKLLRLLSAPPPKVIIYAHNQRLMIPAPKTYTLV